jgi:hypothetical protein
VKRARTRARRLRVILGGASLGTTLLSIWALQPVTGLADPGAIAVDRQAYVSDAGPDVYQVFSVIGGTSGPDTIDIHVGGVGGSPTYHSFIHVELEAIPSDATVHQLTVTLKPTTDTQRKAENLNSSQAVLDAYPLKTELPIKFDPTKPPLADTSWPVVVGKVNDKDGSWSFDLTAMLPYWRTHGNTGAAILPNPVATQPWSIGFDRTLSAATAGFAVPPLPQQDQSQPAPAPALGASDTGPGLGVGLPPAVLSTQRPDGDAAHPGGECRRRRRARHGAALDDGARGQRGRVGSPAGAAGLAGAGRRRWAPGGVCRSAQAPSADVCGRRRAHHLELQPRRLRQHHRPGRPGDGQRPGGGWRGCWGRQWDRGDAVA